MEKFLSKYIRITISLLICTIFISSLVFHNMLPSASSQELEERLHTDWAIADYMITPSTPRAGEVAKIQVFVGIETILEPLPQTVEIILKIDGDQKDALFLTFERDPKQIISAHVDWAATPGKHRFEWIIDPFSRYDDPDLGNNYVAFDLEVVPPEEIAKTTETVTTTITEPLSAATALIQVETITETKTIIETEMITKVTEILRSETITETRTSTEHLSFVIMEKTTEISTRFIKEIEKHLDYLALGAYGGVLALVSGILGLILGRKISPKPGLLNLEKKERLPKTAIFSSAIYRPARRLNEDEWEAKPGDYVPDADGIVAVDEEGNVTIVSGNKCLYSSDIEKRSLSREDLEKMDRRILESLLSQLKSTRETTEAMKLELNDKQKKAIEEVIQKMEEELTRRKLIQ